MTGDPAAPLVTVAVPVYNEETHIGGCLDALSAQTYIGVIEIVVVDGGSTDRTREVVARSGGNVRLLDNPRRIQSAALNVALRAARGEVFVRVDGHCVVDPDYVERCVQTLEGTGAAMVGGAMHPVASGWLPNGIAAAMSSTLGAGPARFHVGGPAGWVDTVYLGAFRTSLARGLGGYREDVGVNEDAELALRMRAHGGVWFEPSIRSTYSPRSALWPVARQFYRYGRSRAATVRLHPGAIAPRQLAAPLLVTALASPWRRVTLAAYTAFLAVAASRQLAREPRSTPGLVLALPAMHLPWGIGFLRGLLLPEHPAT